jgi:low affinity Fe/Cu permease
MAMSRQFSRVANWIAAKCGHAGVFITAVAIVVVWAVTGPLFDYSDTWQLIINTGTTIITFLMIFLIQNTQNRDTAAIQLKLDELIRANQNARNAMLCLENNRGQVEAGQNSVCLPGIHSRRPTACHGGNGRIDEEPTSHGKGSREANRSACRTWLAQRLSAGNFNVRDRSCEHPPQRVLLRRLQAL